MGDVFKSCVLNFVGFGEFFVFEWGLILLFVIFGLVEVCLEIGFVDVSNSKVVVLSNKNEVIVGRNSYMYFLLNWFVECILVIYVFVEIKFVLRILSLFVS